MQYGFCKIRSCHLRFLTFTHAIPVGREDQPVSSLAINSRTIFKLLRTVAWAAGKRRGLWHGSARCRSGRAVLWASILKGDLE
jgi:hypothetical protein